MKRILSNSVHPLAIGFAIGLTCLGTVGLSSGAEEQDAPAPAKKPIVDQKTIQGLIRQLGDASFDKREAAQKELAAIGLPALELLRKAATDADDLEVRERATDLAKLMNHLRFRPAVNDKLWGDSVNPDGDCLFHAELGKLYIKVPGKPYRLGIESGPGATNAPRVLQDVEGDFSVEVQIPDPPPKAQGNHLGKYPFFAAGIVVWQYERNYLRLERARLVFNATNAPGYVSWELRSGGKHTRKGTADDGRFDDAKPAFLKLDRKGNVFTAAFSQDGNEWRDLPAIPVELASKLKIGVSVSQNTSAGYEAVFDRWKVTTGK